MALKNFRFPFSRKDVLKKWIIAVRRKNFKPTSASHICSIHFRDTDFINDERMVLQKLKKDAVPSIFPSLPEHLQRKPKVARKISSHSVCYNLLFINYYGLIHSKGI